MTMVLKGSRFALGLVAGLATGNPALANPEDCVAIENDIARLQCFDAAFASAAKKPATPDEAFEKFAAFLAPVDAMVTDGEPRTTGVYQSDGGPCDVLVTSVGYRPAPYQGHYLADEVNDTLYLVNVQKLSPKPFNGVGYAIVTMKRGYEVVSAEFTFNGLPMNTRVSLSDARKRPVSDRKIKQDRAAWVVVASESHDIDEGFRLFSDLVRACQAE